jgi:hypothetical protein
MARILVGLPDTNAAAPAAAAGAVWRDWCGFSMQARARNAALRPAPQGRHGEKSIVDKTNCELLDQPSGPVAASTAAP